MEGDGVGLALDSDALGVVDGVEGDGVGLVSDVESGISNVAVGLSLDSDVIVVVDGVKGDAVGLAGLALDSGVFVVGN